ncbi:hypothetical protein DFA_00260 [Cavenderia fasciculata]|uniref:Uncharacterized protein n=1 Tax=Cavenderia fasciculata TaxID=261658 RepID=F4PY22_CACFS|nr:uncharacterized protein DFA_00260 [Cavenderia fasciculata]EGG19682.1 hypothetical protein DFA_00260 [Cavenderia fasciculata]|eukprot:XP_004357976.1 hypothetical protein DFA_00260 [Cavenderia fasciculata]
MTIYGVIEMRRVGASPHSIQLKEKEIMDTFLQEPEGSSQIIQSPDLSASSTLPKFELAPPSQQQSIQFPLLPSQPLVGFSHPPPIHIGQQAIYLPSQQQQQQPIQSQQPFSQLQNISMLVANSLAEHTRMGTFDHLIEEETDEDDDSSDQEQEQEQSSNKTLIGKRKDMEESSSTSTTSTTTTNNNNNKTKTTKTKTTMESGKSYRINLDTLVVDPDGAILVSPKKRKEIGEALFQDPIPYPLPNIKVIQDKKIVNRKNEYFVLLEGSVNYIWLPSDQVPKKLQADYNKWIKKSKQEFKVPYDTKTLLSNNNNNKTSAKNTGKKKKQQEEDDEYEEEEEEEEDDDDEDYKEEEDHDEIEVSGEEEKSRRKSTKRKTSSKKKSAKTTPKKVKKTTTTTSTKKKSTTPRKKKTDQLHTGTSSNPTSSPNSSMDAPMTQSYNPHQASIIQTTNHPPSSEPSSIVKRGTGVSSSDYSTGGGGGGAPLRSIVGSSTSTSSTSSTKPGVTRRSTAAKKTQIKSINNHQPTTIETRIDKQNK